MLCGHNANTLTVKQQAMNTTFKLETLVLASKNPGKIEELETLLAPLGIALKSARDLDLPDVVEDTGSFAGNARKKAEEVAAATGLPALADDSGLCVDALGGDPGVETAHYGGYEKLLKTLETTGPENRGAYFISVLALAIPGEKTAFFEGRVNGLITETAQGEGGFGFDPVFQPEGFDITFAQMDQARKNAVSHRGQALAKFIGYISERL